ncbi:nudC domain-containing protein 1 [Anopheles stephensi]|uniref:NudC domain-containing protein 1 n=1 Tax=Anopheles stephensi TaxID=30069 RepID=A0A182YCQ6_ANOST|nr:nudC domain-containing protein 1 [Anopheles stephensi]XP_035907703.1 nudC domain-containing protein 1 [Anopheles stephensi]
MPHIELAPDRKLLKTNFDGYILSLEPVPVLTTDFSTTNHPHRVKPNEQQYSYYHARLFGMQNHLVRDPWATGQCYYIDATGMVQRVCYDHTLGRIRPPAPVFKLPLAPADLAPDDDATGTYRYNCSLVFPSEQLCLLSDGYGTVRVLDTGDRSTGREWKLQSAIRPVECNLAEGMLPGGSVLLDGRFLVQEGKRLLHFVLLQIEHHAMEKSKSLLHWITLEQSTPPSWTLTVSRTLHSAGYPRYCVLDYHATAVLVACDEPFRFLHDSEHPVVVPEQKPPSADTQEHPAWEQYPFRWTQTADEISVTFEKQPNVQYRVVTEPSSPGGETCLKVFANDLLVIDGTQLFAAIDHEQTVWAMDRKTLEISLQKQTAGVMWPFLLPGGPDDTAGAPADSDNLPSDLPPATNLSAPLEPCDFEGDRDTYYTLERLSCTDHTVTHTVPLGSGPPLFAVTVRAGLPATFALRHDVDACLWQLQPTPYGSEDCRFQHEGTLHAFGYVQASKQQQKYLACPPGMEYAVICESHRGIYIYKASYGAGGAGLRNRTGPQVAIGQYQFVSLKDSGEVLGISCEDEMVLLLTEKAILMLQITNG